jgi:hypothetical protein
MSDTPMTPHHPIMTRAFRDRESAEQAYDAITARGYTDDEIHVLMSDETRKRMFSKHAETTHMGNKALKGAGVGGAVGGAVGATIVGMAAAAAALTIPGLGLVIVGPLAGALAGGAAGAATGGIVGVLVGAGIPETRAKIHEKELSDGMIVLGVKPRHDEDARFFETEWQNERLPR